jgi:putative transposase
MSLPLKRFGDASVQLARTATPLTFCYARHRDKAAARRYFEKSIAQYGIPETVTIDKGGANLAALEVHQ